ncbi:hypothetical protein KUC_2018 [Vreelandella boliviensis LC1]|uniref:Uncharacterized protein n=1 Tax=Vreelandella boliviensis LC1 TaxID=1072583 RepID=A0A7U9BZ51_9GAMM|nr:hypothetical protein KUC_2018 [Halomonas boliviensis LC1]
MLWHQPRREGQQQAEFGKKVRKQPKDGRSLTPHHKTVK